MVSFTSAVVAMITTIGIFQMCPAPHAASNAMKDVAKLQKSIFTELLLADAKQIDSLYLPPGVPRSALTKCHQEVKGQKDKLQKASITDVESVNNDTILINNVPTSCMDLAAALSSSKEQPGGAAVVRMGDHSLQYNGVTRQERERLAKILNT